MSNSGYTCLVTACYKNHPSVVSRLLTREDVDPNWRSEEGDSLMMTCCARSYNSIIQLLVSRPDLDINYTGQRCDTSHLMYECLTSVLSRDLSPLMLACIEGNATGVSTILARHDVNVNIIGKDGVTAISLACLQGNMEIVQMLLACREVNINKMTVDGVTPFTVSIFKVNWEKALVGAFSEYCESHREMSLTPLPPLQGHTGITSLLLDRPELVLGHDLSSVTAADLAEAGEAAWRHTIDAIDPLHVAAAKGQVEVVKRLIRCVR